MENLTPRTAAPSIVWVWIEVATANRGKIRSTSAGRPGSRAGAGNMPSSPKPATKVMIPVRVPRPDW